MMPEAPYDRSNRWLTCLTVDPREAGVTREQIRVHLEKYNIDQSGIITGIYSNGTKRTIGQVALASFTNPGGLEKAGESTFAETNNSGEALVGESGVAVVPGRNVIGRHSGNEVVIDPAYLAISRKHVIIEPISENAALLTDISSHGTFITPKHV